LADDTLGALLGVDRIQDFNHAEREHPDCLAVVWPADRALAISAGEANSLPLFLAPDAVRDSTRTIWYGKANRLSRDDPVQWPFLNQVEVASWKSNTEHRVVALNRSGHTAKAPGIDPGQSAAGQVIRQRRSAVAFDGETSIPVDGFFKMLGRVMPWIERDLCSRPMPWDLLPWQPAIHLALLVHRVDGLAPGIYLLARDPAMAGSLRQSMRQQFAFYEESPRVKSPVAGCPVAGLRLRWAGHLLSYKRFLRWLARFDCECERESLVTTFYPCRRGWPSTRCCIRPKRARRTGFGRSAPSIRTAAHIARPRQITGASTNLQRCKLLSLAGLRGQNCEAMSRASSGITPSAR